MRRMSPELRDRFAADIASARDAARDGDLQSAWVALEDAHVLSQPWVGPHLRTHAEMFLLAAKTYDAREAAGQAVRLILAGPGSMTGRYPKGNTGRARISMFAPMPVAPEVEALLNSR